jgi:recombinational DNA repair protein (RecF pathway)
MRCCGCKRDLSDGQAIFARGTAVCLRCYEKGQVFSRRMLVLMPLLFLLLVSVLLGVMIWCFPEITRR